MNTAKFKRPSNTESFDYVRPFVAEYFGVDADELKKRNVSCSNMPDEWKKNEIDFCKTCHDRMVTDAAVQIEQGYPNKDYAEKLLRAAEIVNPGPWGNHCRIAAECAKKIAAECSMDAEKAYVLGLLHDIGRRFLGRDLGHIYNGYRYMKQLGYAQVAKVCLSHSFPNQDLQIYIGQVDISKGEADTVARVLSEIRFDDYDRLIQLCDALAGSDGVLDIEERMADVKRRYGNYPQAQWDKNIELKHYFEEKIGKSVYDIVM